MGVISLRRRLEPILQVDVWEVKLDDEFLMSSLFTATEEAVGRLGMAATPGDALHVVIGGLGLGHTAMAALEDERIATLHVIDALAEVIGWHRDHLVPLGEQLSDRIAELGGSWAFIIGFGVFLLLWVLVNTLVWASHPPDPYPFIFLNLILSCIAALQAPVIMMSQNRQEIRDRQQAEQDYKINLKAELEIRHLHEKMDHLLHHHSQRLLEIQQIQTDLLRQLVTERRN